MIPYAAREVFNENEVKLWARVSRIVAHLPGNWELDEPTKLWKPDANANQLRCHEVARAVGKLTKLRVVDGYYGMVEHSWLLTAEDTVLDAYCPGRMPQVQLVDSHSIALNERGLHGYRNGYVRGDIEEHLVNCLFWWMERFERTDRGMAEPDLGPRSG